MTIEITQELRAAARDLYESLWAHQGAELEPHERDEDIAALAAAIRGGAVVSAQAERDVIAERRRQVEVEGWTDERDDTAHPNGELALAASGYAWIAGYPDDVRTLYRDMQTMPRDWPWSRDWFKPTDRRRDLVKAGALIIAEIERIDRAITKGSPR